MLCCYGFVELNARFEELKMGCGRMTSFFLKVKIWRRICIEDGFDTTTRI